PSTSSTRFTLFSVVLPIFVAVNVYVIVSPSISTSLSACFTSVIDGSFSTGTSSSTGGVVGLSGSSGSPPGGVPVAVAIFTISSTRSISSCVTTYVPVTSPDSPGASVDGVTSKSPPNISSFTVTPVSVTFPVFVTVNVYVISSPASTTFSLSAFFVKERSAFCSPSTFSSSSSVTGSCSTGLSGSSGSITGGGVPSVFAKLWISPLSKSL